MWTDRMGRVGEVNTCVHLTRHNHQAARKEIGFHEAMMTVLFHFTNRNWSWEVTCAKPHSWEPLQRIDSRILLILIFASKAHSFPMKPSSERMQNSYRIPGQQNTSMVNTPPKKMRAGKGGSRFPAPTHQCLYWGCVFSRGSWKWKCLTSLTCECSLYIHTSLLCTAWGFKEIGYNPG